MSVHGHVALGLDVDGINWGSLVGGRVLLSPNLELSV